MTDSATDSYRLARALDRVVRRLNGMMGQVMPTIDTNRVGPLGSMVMLAISDMQSSSIQELCTQFRRDNSQMTRLLRDLEGKGLIQRQISPDDRRVSLVSLTDAGAAFVAISRASMSDVVDELARQLSARERQDLIVLLERLASVQLR